LTQLKNGQIGSFLIEPCLRRLQSLKQRAPKTFIHCRLVARWSDLFDLWIRLIVMT